MTKVSATTASTAAVKVEKSFDYAHGSHEWFPWVKVTFPAVPANEHDSPIWKQRDELAARLAAPPAAAPTDAANKGRDSLAMWLCMVEAERELCGERALKDADVMLSFMGCGASHNVTFGDLRAAISPPAAATTSTPAWRSHDANDGMRFPEESDLIGGATDAAATPTEPDKPSAAIRAVLAEYANPLNWGEDEHGIRRVWLEPGSTTPTAYNGFESARAAIASRPAAATPIAPEAEHGSVDLVAQISPPAAALGQTTDEKCSHRGG